MKIAVGSDHGGFALKEAVKKHLEAKGIEVEDFGCYSTESVDYAVYGAKVAHCVADGKADYGVLVCSTGIGISMAANKVKGTTMQTFCVSAALSPRRRPRWRSWTRSSSLTLRAAATSAVSTRSQILKTDACKAEIGEINMENNEQIFIMNHPLIQHKLSFLRDKNTGTKEFRELVSEIATLMCYEATRDLPLMDVQTETPMCTATTKVIAGRKLAFVPILRAGLGMVDGMLQLVPSAKVGHIGLYRDHDTLQPVEYYNKLPSDIEERDVIVLDPMLATGGSAMDAITIVKRSRPRSIKFLCIIAAPEGLKALSEAHPDVHIYCAAVDEKLNEHGYILPGLGDAGDRIFGTM